MGSILHSTLDVSIYVYAEIFTSILGLYLTRAILTNTHLWLKSLNLKIIEKWPEWGEHSIEIKNQTQDIVDLLEGKRHVGCKWIFTMKYKSDGSLDRYKVRLVTKGYTQTCGIDYHEIFAPMAKMNTTRILLSLVAMKESSLC